MIPLGGFLDLSCLTPPPGPLPQDAIWQVSVSESPLRNETDAAPAPLPGRPFPQRSQVTVASVLLPVLHVFGASLGVVLSVLRGRDSESPMSARTALSPTVGSLKSSLMLGGVR